MFGYTVVTFYGYMGWGIGSYFGNQYNLSESFYFNNQSLIWNLQKSFVDKANADLDFVKLDRHSIDNAARKRVSEYAKKPDNRAMLDKLPSNQARNQLLSKLLRKYSSQMFNEAVTKEIKANNIAVHDKKKMIDLFNGLWDRDVVAFYGDPAWVARHNSENPAWKATWSHTGENVEVKVAILKDGKWGNRPLAIPFPVRLGRIRGIECSHGLKPLVTDDFAMLPVMGKERKAGDTIVLRFRGSAIDPKATSAKASG